jgi:type VI secretion system protein ImpH
MAGEDRTAADAVEIGRLMEALRQKPYDFDFYHAIRRLECLHRDKPRIGQSLRPVDDPIRLGQEPSLGFAPSTIAWFRPAVGESPPRMGVNFFGLLGPNGPLPLHLTEYARDRLRNAGDPTFVRFLDMFHHRMLSLFYRMWASAQPTVNFDRPEQDRFSVYAGSLFGIGMPSLRDRDDFPDLAKLHHTGQLVCQTRHADGLRAILADFFRLPVEVERFVGQWLELPEDFWCRLGAAREVSTLGESVTIGSRTWECQSKFRVVFGPLGYEDYQALLPGGESLKCLVALVRNYTGDELDWDMKLILKKDEVPALQLGVEQRLGWTSWLAGGPRQKDADDLTLDPLPAAAPARGSFH